MKIKNILVSLFAILALAAGCNQIEPDHYLDEVSLSTSYVSLSMAGGSSSVEAFFVASVGSRIFCHTVNCGSRRWS